MNVPSIMFLKVFFLNNIILHAVSLQDTWDIRKSLDPHWTEVFHHEEIKESPGDTAFTSLTTAVNFYQIWSSNSLTHRSHTSYIFKDYEHYAWPIMNIMHDQQWTLNKLDEWLVNKNQPILP